MMGCPLSHPQFMLNNPTATENLIIKAPPNKMANIDNNNNETSQLNISNNLPTTLIKNGIKDNLNEENCFDKNGILLAQSSPAKNIFTLFLRKSSPNVVGVNGKILPCNVGGNGQTLLIDSQNNPKNRIKGCGSFAVLKRLTGNLSASANKTRLPTSYYYQGVNSSEDGTEMMTVQTGNAMNNVEVIANHMGLYNKIGSNYVPVQGLPGNIKYEILVRNSNSSGQLTNATLGNTGSGGVNVVSAKDILSQKFNKINLFKNGTGSQSCAPRNATDEQRFFNDPRLPLNRRQIFSLSKSWKGISRNMDTTGVMMFVKLFSTSPKLLPLFKNIVVEGGEENKMLVSVKDSIELETHAEIVMNTMDEAITNFGDFDKFNQILTSIGYYHYGLDGFKVEFFGLAEEPFLEAVKETLGDRYTNNMENIYKISIKFILATLVKGYFMAKEGS